MPPKLRRRTEEHARLHRRWERRFPQATSVLERDGIDGLRQQCRRLTDAVDSLKTLTRDSSNLLSAVLVGALVSGGIGALSSLLRAVSMSTSGSTNLGTAADGLVPLLVTIVVILMFVAIENGARKANLHALIWHQRRQRSYLGCLHEIEAQAAARDHQSELALLQRIVERRWWRPLGRARPAD